MNKAELIAAAKELDIAVMGPNCAGFVNYIDNVQAFAFISAKRDRKGSVGVVSQSGQLCLSMMDDPGMRFSYNISAGNGKIVQMEDYMDFLVDDEDTKVVSIYIEGVKNADKFAAVLKKAAEKRKPVVILKAGRSAKGGAIAASHTGSLSGSDASFDAVLKKFGAIRVDDLEENAGKSNICFYELIRWRNRNLCRCRKLKWNRISGFHRRNSEEIKRTASILCFSKQPARYDCKSFL